MRSAGLDEAQAGMKMAGRHIHPLRYAHDSTLTAEMKPSENIHQILGPVENLNQCSLLYVVNYSQLTVHPIALLKVLIFFVH